MSQPKLTMKEEDVQCAIKYYVLRNYQGLSVQGKEKPEKVHNVLATIQGREYNGAGKYQVLLDFYGSMKDGESGFKENEHFTATCSVVVKAGTDDSPMIEITDNIIITRQII